MTRHQPTSPDAELGSQADLARQLVRDLPALNTLEGTAKFFGRTGRTLRHWIARGLIRTVRPCGGNPMVPRSEIERVLREGAHG